MPKAYKIISGIFILFVIAFFSYKIGFLLGKEAVLETPPSSIINPNSDTLKDRIDFSVFWEAWRRLENDFFEKERIDYKKMMYGAIDGMVKSLGDPYTTFFTPQKTEEFDKELSGKYEGVGMEVGIRDNVLTVISPLEDTPAQRAGLMPGDKILKINDTSTEDVSLEEAVSMIRGPEGTTVTLLIDRESWDSPKPITLERAEIKIPTLKWEIKEYNGKKIAYIKMYQFNQILEPEFKKMAVSLLNSSADRIVLDLRNNPGGYLDVAQKIASWFLKKGETVVWQDMGPGKKKKEYKANGPAKFVDFPVVVLINKGSASAAEILAGALRDNRGVKLIGETSFGKGSVQEQVFLKDGSSLKITVAKWLTPNGTSINEKGLTPDIEVKMTEEDIQEGKDPQLEKALEIVSGL
jgi:carboxyl-terminal processing protease